MSTMATSGWPGGPTVSQRKLPISGTVTSLRTSKPTFSVQYFSASSWSCTHSWAVAMLIMLVLLVSRVCVVGVGPRGGLTQSTATGAAASSRNVRTCGRP